MTNEITNALNSIMTDSDFENFAALEPQNRLESLKEIRLIVCGIVLFNKDTGIGCTMDENIPDCENLSSTDVPQSIHPLSHCSDKNFGEVLRVD